MVEWQNRYTRLEIWNKNLYLSNQVNAVTEPDHLHN